MAICGLRCAPTQNNSFNLLIVAARDGDEGSNVKVAGDIEYPQVAMKRLIVCLEFLKVRFGKTREIYCRLFQPVIPP